MKLFRILPIFFALSLIPLITAQESGDVIEEAILWRAELNPDWSPVDLSALVQDGASFEESGNFYKAIIPITAFGGNLTYVGLLGVEMLPGPNAVVESSPQEIVTYLENRYDLSFESDDSGRAFQSRLEEDVMLVIFEHPSLADSSVIIGAYLGP